MDFPLIVEFVRIIRNMRKALVLVLCDIRCVLCHWKKR